MLILFDNIGYRLYWDVTHDILLWLIRFSNIHWCGCKRRHDDPQNFSSCLGWDRSLACDIVTNMFHCTILQTIFCISWDIFRCIHRMYVVHVLMVSMFTSINNMRTRHVQELCVASIELKNNVSICLSLCVFDDHVQYLHINLARCKHCCDFSPSFVEQCITPQIW